MKSVIACITLLLSVHFVTAQMVAKVEIKKPIPGVCNYKEVYSLFPMFGDQKEAVCPVTEEEIQRQLDSAVVFLKDRPEFKDKGIVSILINCKGEAIKCEMDNKTKDTALDNQIVAVFKTLVQWKAGLLNGKPVDSMRLFSFEIINGKLKL
jgi:hypothetical protein